MTTKDGRQVLKRRRAKGRKRLTVSDEAETAGLSRGRQPTSRSPEPSRLSAAEHIRKREEFERIYNPARTQAA